MVAAIVAMAGQIKQLIEEVAVLVSVVGRLQNRVAAMQAGPNWQHTAQVILGGDIEEMAGIVTDNLGTTTIGNVHDDDPDPG